MSAAHTIERLTVRWGVVPDEHRRRAQQLQEALVDAALEDVLDGIGIGVASHEEVCVRDVIVPPYAGRWSDTDAQLLDGWSRAIAAAIAATVGSVGSVGSSGSGVSGTGSVGGGGPLGSSGAGVIRYASLEHAALDLVASTLTGDTERAWAWAQLGLWPAGPIAGAGAAADHVRIVVRTLRDRPHLLVPAAVRLAGRGSIAALVTALGSDAFVDVVDAAWTTSGGTPQHWLAGARGDDPATREAAAAAIVARSAIWRAATADGRAFTTGDSALAFAALALLETEPALARSHDPAATVRAVVATERARELDVTAARTAASTRPEPEPQPPPAGGEPEPARTAWGGLVFLVRLAVATGAADRFLECPGASVRALHWALGRALVDRAATEHDPPVLDDDAALLAFCGLPPGAAVPETDADVTGEVELVVAALRAAVETDGEDPLRLVCHRDATVEAEPGWIDVVFAIDDVSTDVRRAGLDLDPGYVAALGCVLRFRYA